LKRLRLHTNFIHLSLLLLLCVCVTLGHWDWIAIDRSFPGTVNWHICTSLGPDHQPSEQWKWCCPLFGLLICDGEGAMPRGRHGVRWIDWTQSYWWRWLALCACLQFSPSSSFLSLSVARTVTPQSSNSQLFGLIHKGASWVYVSCCRRPLKLHCLALRIYN